MSVVQVPRASLSSLDHTVLVCLLLRVGEKRNLFEAREVGGLILAASIEIASRSYELRGLAATGLFSAFFFLLPEQFGASLAGTRH